jgi:hypothetical protein
MPIPGVHECFNRIRQPMAQSNPSVSSNVLYPFGRANYAAISWQETIEGDYHDTWSEGTTRNVCLWNAPT